jgi:hypothetical protein
LINKKTGPCKCAIRSNQHRDMYKKSLKTPLGNEPNSAESPFRKPAKFNFTKCLNTINSYLLKLVKFIHSVHKFIFFRSITISVQNPTSINSIKCCE